MAGVTKGNLREKDDASPVKKKRREKLNR